MLRNDELVGHGGDPAQRFVCRASKFCLDFSERAARGLAAFDGNDLLQVPSAILRRAPLHDGPVDESGRRVPPHNPPIGQLSDSPVGRPWVGGTGQRSGNPSHQLVKRPRRLLGHTYTLTLSR